MSLDEPEIPEGLPEALPRGEQVLWQGRPSPVALTLHAFRWNWVAGYFAVLLAWRFVAFLVGGEGLVAAAADAAWIVPLAATALALLALLGWASARTTLYTVTDRRIVLRIGVALSVTVNLPYGVVQSASVKRNRDGSGDIAFALEPGARAAYAVLWPHARPFRYGRPEPTLRAIPDVDAVAERIRLALGATARMAPAAVRGRSEMPAGMVAAAE